MKLVTLTRVRTNYFMTHQLNDSFFYDLLYKGYSRTCIFHWAQKVSCERNNSVFISRLSLELNASRWVNIDLIFFNSLLCSGNVLLQPVCRSWNYPLTAFQLSSKPFQPKDRSPICSRFIWYQERLLTDGQGTPNRPGPSHQGPRRSVQNLGKEQRIYFSAQMILKI